MKTSLFLNLFLFLLSFTIQAQDNPPSAEEAQEGVNALQNQIKSLFEYYEKYDEKSSKKDKKDAFDKAAEQISGGTADEKDKKDAFNIVDAYIKADQGQKVEIDNQKKEGVVDFLNQMKNGKQDALAIFKEATTDAKMDQMRTSAAKELYKGGVRYKDGHPTWYTYEEFEAIVLKGTSRNPPPSEGEIRAVYNAWNEDFKRGNPNFRPNN